MDKRLKKDRIYNYDDKFVFVCEMFDTGSDSFRNLVMYYFPFDNSLKIIDVDKQRVLLTRVECPTVKMDNLRIGQTVLVFSKLIYIKDCDGRTREKLFSRTESTFAMIKPMPPKDYGKILNFIIDKGYTIKNMKNGRIDKDFIVALCKSSNVPNLPVVTEYLTSGEVIGLELVGDEAVARWRRDLGHFDPARAAPGTLRRAHGHSALYNCAHGCETAPLARMALEYFFGSEVQKPLVPLSACMRACTCGVVLPHAIKEQRLGALLQAVIAAGFTVTAMAMFTLPLHLAMEFYELYKGVLAEYPSMSQQLAEGPCLVMEITREGPSDEHIVTAFRNFCGPRDPDLCRQLYPNSLRSLYGTDIIHNAVHCTDLEEDGVSEVEYFFKLVMNA